MNTKCDRTRRYHLKDDMFLCYTQLIKAQKGQLQYGLHSHQTPQTNGAKESWTSGSYSPFNKSHCWTHLSNPQAVHFLPDFDVFFYPLTFSTLEEEATHTVNTEKQHQEKKESKNSCYAPWKPPKGTMHQPGAREKECWMSAASLQ